MGNSGLHYQHSRFLWVFTRIVTSLLVICSPVLFSSCEKPPAPVTTNPGSEWSVFLHDQQNSGRNDVGMKIPTRVVWSKSFRINEDFQAMTSPIVYKGNVICCTSDGFLRAFDLRDGSEAWKMSTKIHLGEADITPCGTRNRVVSFFGGFLYATPANKNETLWAKAILMGLASGGTVTTPLVPDGDKIFFSTDAGVLHAVSLRNGEVIWRTKRLNGLSQNQAPCVAEGKVFLPSGGAESGDQRIYCVNENTGQVLWESNISESLTKASIVYSGGRIYTGDDSGSVFCLDVNDGHKIWSSQLRDAVIATPTVIGDFVVVADESEILYGLNKQDGQHMWELDNKEDISRPVVASHDFVIFVKGGGFTMDDTSLLFVDYRTGKVIKTLGLSGLSGSPSVRSTFTPIGLVVVKDRIILVTKEATIMCLGN